jgi:hypothetical protein
MGENELLIAYKALRLPLLVLALGFITWYVYGGRKRRAQMEEPKYRMLEED